MEYDHTIVEAFAPWERQWVDVGIDETGRGACLGPMVYGGVFSLVDADLSEYAFDDSKKLTAEERRRIAASVWSSQSLGWALHSISAAGVSAAAFAHPSYHLNTLARDAILEIVGAVHACNLNIRHLVVDAVGTCQQLRVFLRAVLPYIPKITVEVKADAKYALVGAASIIAKVHRDREHERHTFTETGALREKLEALRSEMGSGYPADQETKAWLGQVMDPVFGFPSNVRSSWKTVRRLQLEADVPMLERQAVPRPDPAAPLGRAFSEVRIQPSSSMDDPAPVADAIWQKITEAEKRKLKFPRRKKKRQSTAPVADKSSRTRKPPRWFPARREPASPDWFRPAPEVAFRPLRRKWRKRSAAFRVPMRVPTPSVVFYGVK